LYLVINTGTDTTSFDSLTRNQLVIKLNELFIEDNEDAHIRFLIDTTEYVPLELDKAPVSEAQTEQKKKLMLSLTPSASEILKNFSSRHVMQKVVIVVNGEALTMHKVREPITSGQLQITRCTDNACEKLYIMMKDNIKK
jgi:preprotein translocase subunit SecD